MRVVRAMHCDRPCRQAVETLCELLRTLLSCVRLDHPPEVAHHAEMAVLEMAVLEMAVLERVVGYYYCGGGGFELFLFRYCWF